MILIIINIRFLTEKAGRIKNPVFEKLGSFDSKIKKFEKVKKIHLECHLWCFTAPCPFSNMIYKFQTSLMRYNIKMIVHVLL